MNQVQQGADFPRTASDCFIANRARLPVEELTRHAGEWVGLSPDGSHILDSCLSLVELHKRLAAAGHDLRAVVFERVPTDDMILSGSELS